MVRILMVWLVAIAPLGLTEAFGQDSPDGGPRFERTASHGHAPDEWIAQLSGIAFFDGRLYFFDQGASEVRVLDSNMDLVTRFGRQGGGPGEFSSIFAIMPSMAGSPFVDANRLAVDRNGVVVQSGDELERFDLDGARSATISNVGLRGMMFSFGPRFVAPWDGSVLIGVDSFDLGGRSPRRMQTWRVSKESSQKIWEVPAIEPLRSGRGFTAPAELARPLWAMSEDRVFVSDGASDIVRSFNANTGVEKDFRVPQALLPQPVAMSDSSATLTLDSSGRPTLEPRETTSSLEASALRRWSAMTAAPDGKIWLRVAASKEPKAVVLDPRTGTTALYQLPAFPRAFDSEGGFFAVEVDPATDLTLITHYRLIGRNQGTKDRNVDTKLGSVEAGKIADMALIRGDLTADPSGINLGLGGWTLGSL